jgi:hypothetical protein
MFTGTQHQHTLIRRKTKTNVDIKVNLAFKVPGSDVLFRSQIGSNTLYFDISHVGGYLSDILME